MRASTIIGIQHGPSIEKIGQAIRRELLKFFKLEHSSGLTVEIDKMILSTGDNPLKLQCYIPIAKQLLNELKDDILTAKYLDSIAKRLRNIGEHWEAMEYASRALQARRAVLEADSPEIGDSLCNLSVIHRYLGNLPESEVLANQAIDFYKTYDIPNKLTELATAIYKKTLTMLELGRIC